MSTNTTDLKPAIEAIARLVAPKENGRKQGGQTATHEKQLNKKIPWVLMGAGATVMFASALLLSFAGLHGVLTLALSLGLYGLCGFGGLLIFIGLPLQKRVEDWENWQTPARQIAEIHAKIQKVEAQQEAIELDRVRREHRLMDLVEECSERQDAAISAVIHAMDGLRGEVDDAFVDALSEQEDGQKTNGHKVVRLVRPRDPEWPKRT